MHVINCLLAIIILAIKPSINKHLKKKLKSCSLFKISVSTNLFYVPLESLCEKMLLLTSSIVGKINLLNRGKWSDPLKSTNSSTSFNSNLSECLPKQWSNHLPWFLSKFTWVNVLLFKTPTLKHSKPFLFKKLLKLIYCCAIKGWELHSGKYIIFFQLKFVQALIREQQLYAHEQNFIIIHHDIKNRQKQV